MMRIILVVSACLVLTACGQSSAPPPVATSCNQVAPNLAIPAMLQGSAVPSATLSRLGDGHIPPGLYDLASGEQFDGAPSWEDTRSVSVGVSDAPGAQVIEWAQLAGPEQKTRTDWTARLQAGPQPTLIFTCGRTGSSAITYSTEGGELHLRLPDVGGTGVLDLVFLLRQN